MNFVPFVEKNDWEGEEWTFWLQIEGNEEELGKLEDILEGSETYSIDLSDEVEDVEVERICRRAKNGYFMSDQLVMGKFTCPVNEHNQTEIEFLDDMFYKGRTERHFEEE